MDDPQAEAKILEKQEALPPAPRRLPGVRPLLQPLVLPALSILTSLVVGAIFILITGEETLRAWANFPRDPLNALVVSWTTVSTAYAALFRGALGNPVEIISGLIVYVQTGEATSFLRSIQPLGESLLRTTPYIFGGLAVAVGFRGGLFNIGAEGQLIVGGLATAFVGYSIKGLPWIIHMPLALVVGALAGALWAFIPGYLKARVGAHEVINTIMMNWTAIFLAQWLLAGPMSRGQGVVITQEIQPSAYLPQIFPHPVRFHVGFFLGLAVAYFAWWWLFKTTMGFEIRAVGVNPSAAKAAGMNIGRNIVLAMIVSGAMGGLAGTVDVLGWRHNMGIDFSAGVGFDSIAVALLAKSHPIGVVFSALLFGMLRAGAKQMEVFTDIPLDLLQILQALVIAFVAAPAIVRSLYRIRVEWGVEELVTRGWQQQK